MKKMCSTRRLIRFIIAISLVTPFSRILAVELLSEDFTGGDGGFTEEATGNSPIPAVYDSSLGTWAMAGDDTGPATNTLTSPVITVPSTAGIRVSFDHRFSIEAEWDGTAIQVSIDGGEFKTVPSSAFTQNGYTFSGLIGNHVLAGGDGFNGESDDYFDGDFITSVASVGGVKAGGTIVVRFLGAWDEGARGEGDPNWEIASIIVDTLPDTDSDGMPDVYETANDLNPAVDDSMDDADLDTVTNIAEYLQETNPQLADTDMDGLNDNVETNTGEWVDATDTGTDPLRADTDGDELLDGVESNTGIFVDDDSPGTSPLLADSDGDAIPDQIEIGLSTDPTDSEDFTRNWVVRNAQSSSALNSIANTRDLFSGVNRSEEIVTIHENINFRDNADGPFPDPIAFPVLEEQDLDANDFAILAYGTFYAEVAGHYTFGFNSDDGGGLWIDGEPVVIVDANRGSDTSLGSVFLPFGNHQVEFLYWERGGGAQCQLFAHSEMGDFANEGFDVADYELLMTSYLEPEDAVDSDGDSLIDLWEISYFEDLTQGAEDDPDEDGLANKEEFAGGTDPTKADTDEDGLPDGVEDNSGTWVDSTKTGTDPLDSDTDDDELLDGVETNTGVFVSVDDTGSSPLLADTDSSGVDDGNEAAAGSNPSDPESEPGRPDVLAVAYWPLDEGENETSAVDIVGGYNGTAEEVIFGAPGARPYTGTSASFDGISRIQVDHDLALNPESFTLTVWVRSEGGSVGYNSVITSRNDLNPDSEGYVIYDSNVGNWQFWSGNGTDAGNWQTVTGTDVQLDEWEHLTIRYDDNAQVKTLFVNGESVATQEARIEPNQATPFNIGVGQDQGDGFWFLGNIDDLALFKVALTDEEIVDVYENGVAAFIGGGGPGFAITKVEQNPETGAVSLTWSSQLGASYAVERTTDFEDWQELDDGVDGEEGSTVFTDSDIDEGIRFYYYRVVAQ